MKLNKVKFEGKELDAVQRIEIKCTKCGRKAIANMDITKPNDYICSICTKREELLKACEIKGIHPRIQYDCHFNVESGDDVMHPDGDGDCLMSGSGFELCNFEGLRVQFSPDTSPVDAIRALDKIKDWIQRQMISGYKRNLYTPKIKADKRLISEEVSSVEANQGLVMDNGNDLDDIPF